MQNVTQKKILVIGCGSMGRKHINNLISLGYNNLMCYDVDIKSLEKIKQSFGIKTCQNLDTAIEDSDAVIICSPNSFHREHILKSIEKGKQVFVEKPISDKLAGLDKAARIINEKKLIFQVGYNLRHHPALIKTKQMIDKNEIGKILHASIEFGSYFPNWRPGIDPKKNYGANKSMGGGIILDDVHEIDYAVWLFGLFGNVQEVFCAASRISNVTIDTEDIADIILRFENGLVVTIHMDYLQRAKTRSLKIIGSQGVIEAELNKNILRVFKEDNWKEEKGETLPSGDFDYNTLYTKEIKDFLESLEPIKESKEKYLQRINKQKSKQMPEQIHKQIPKRIFKQIPGIETGIYGLKIALAAKESAETGKLIKIK